MTENTVNNLADEEIEHVARSLADDVSLLLDERNVEHETHVEWNGNEGEHEGWYVVFIVGEWTFTFVTAEQRWLWQLSTEDGDDGPYGLPELDADSSPVEIAEYIAANVEESTKDGDSR